jgi:hypothetical protein
VKDHKVFVMPSQRKFGLEWPLAYTYPDFAKKVLSCFMAVEHTEPRFQAKCFNLWGMLVQGIALTSCSMVIVKKFHSNEKKNEENALEKAIKLYLKSLVGLKNIGNQVICQIFNQKNPAMMVHHFEHHHRQLLCYVRQNNLLCIKNYWICVLFVVEGT